MSRFRQGRQVGNTLYDGETFIGSCVSAKAARELVRLANAEHDRRNEEARAGAETIAVEPEAISNRAARRAMEYMFDHPGVVTEKTMRGAILAALNPPPVAESGAKREPSS